MYSNHNVQYTCRILQCTHVFQLQDFSFHNLISSSCLLLLDHIHVFIYMQCPLIDRAHQNDTTSLTIYTCTTRTVWDTRI